MKNNKRLSWLKKAEPAYKKKIHRKERGKGFFGHIKNKLILSFMIPVCLIILLGIISYKLAAANSIKNYEKNTLQTLNMVGDYINLGMESIKDLTTQYLADDDLGKYFKGIYSEDSAGYTESYRSISKKVTSKKLSDKFIQSIHIVSPKAEVITTDNTSLSGEELYQGILETKEGSLLNEDRNKALWISEGDYLDQSLKLRKSDYALRYMRSFVNFDGFIIVDLKTKVIQDIYSNLDYGEQCYFGFIAEDGSELIYPQNSEIQFKDAMNKEKDMDADGYYYTDYKGQNYLFCYSKVGTTGAIVTALIPKSEMVKQVSEIKFVTFGVVILASVIALLITFFMSKGIGDTISLLIKKLNLAAKGDLTVNLETKREDEFADLTDSISKMLNNNRNLIKHVSEISEKVKTSAGKVENISMQFVNETRNISNSMNEIGLGMEQQADDSSECLVQMDELSMKIETVYGNTTDVGQLASKTRLNVKENMTIMNELRDKAKDTNEITGQIIKDIHELEDTSTAIRTVIDLLDGIADQTSLLSLNASIEAARAGEAGRGFSVVAEEIRKLAEQSLNASREIRNMIDDTQTCVNTVVTSSNMAKEIINQQEAAVSNALNGSDSMNQDISLFIDKIKDIMESIQIVENNKKTVLSAIQNISAIIEETVAASEEVNSVIESQVNSADHLNNAFHELNGYAAELNESIGAFKLN